MVHIQDDSVYMFIQKLIVVPLPPHIQNGMETVAWYL